MKPLIKYTNLIKEIVTVFLFSYIKEITLNGSNIESILGANEKWGETGWFPFPLAC